MIIPGDLTGNSVGSFVDSSIEFLLVMWSVLLCRQPVVKGLSNVCENLA